MDAINAWFSAALVAGRRDVQANAVCIMPMQNMMTASVWQLKQLAICFRDTHLINDCSNGL